MIHDPLAAIDTGHEFRIAHKRYYASAGEEAIAGANCSPAGITARARRAMLE
jgi:hypothetical protein